MNLKPPNAWILYILDEISFKSWLKSFLNTKSKLNSYF